MLLPPEHLIYMIEIAGLQVEAVCCSAFGRRSRLLSPFAPLVRMLARRYHRKYRLPRRLEDIVLSPVCLYGRALVVAARVAQGV